MNCEDKWDSEEFYMGVLLVCGGEPEPDLDHSTPTYSKWRESVQQFVNSCSPTEVDVFNRWFMKYYAWLSNRKLGWGRR